MEVHDGPLDFAQLAKLLVAHGLRVDGVQLPARPRTVRRAAAAQRLHVAYPLSPKLSPLLRRRFRLLVRIELISDVGHS